MTDDERNELFDRLAVGFEEIQLGQKRLQVSQKELVEQQKKTDVQLAKTDAQLAENIGVSYILIGSEQHKNWENISTVKLRRIILVHSFPT